jgi:cytochrome c oxidase cbb3-type subunit III
MQCLSHLGVRIHLIRWATALCAFFLVFCPKLRAQQLQQSYRQIELDRGAALYSSNCQECHADGTAVPGVNFRTGQFPAGSSDADLMNAIRNGIPGTVMPPHDFSPGDVVAVLAYIRALAEDRSSPVKLGDPVKGKAIFEADGCYDCHRVGERGSYSALNLSDSGTLHPPSYVRRALLDPDSSLAAVPESRLVRAVTKQGKVVTGRRLNEDTFTIQLVDSGQNLISLDKSGLKSLTIIDESPMPSLKGKLSDKQIDDLVAYLATLKSVPDATAAVSGTSLGVVWGTSAPGLRAPTTPVGASSPASGIRLPNAAPRSNEPTTLPPGRSQ